MGAYLALIVFSVAVRLSGGPSTVRWLNPSFGNVLVPIWVFVIIVIYGYWNSRCVLVDAWGVTVRNGFWAKERIDWLDVRVILVAEREHLTFVTRDREVAARMLPSFAYWAPSIKTRRRMRMQFEVLAVRDWLDQWRTAAVSGEGASWGTQPPLR
jgi:hypothetical protein